MIPHLCCMLQSTVEQHTSQRRFTECEFIAHLTEFLQAFKVQQQFVDKVTREEQSETVELERKRVRFIFIMRCSDALTDGNS